MITRNEFDCEDIQESILNSLPDGNRHCSTEPTGTTLFDDIFESDTEPRLRSETEVEECAHHTAKDSSLAVDSLNVADNTTEPSEVPLLERVHLTSGYRDGIADGKMQSVQAGFDEGYSLGAVIGLRAGWILGVFDGLLGMMACAQRERLSAGKTGMAKERDGLKYSQGASGNRQIAERNEDKKEKFQIFNDASFRDLKDLHNQAKDELCAVHLFGSRFFGEDGIWLFDVPPSSSPSAFTATTGFSDSEADFTFEQIAKAHPSLKAWEEMVLRWAKKMSISIDR